MGSIVTINFHYFPVPVDYISDVTSIVADVGYSKTIVISGKYAAYGGNEMRHGL